jgi:uncharacterized protein
LTHAQRSRWAYALSGHDVPGAPPQAQPCEDCACSVTGSGPGDWQPAPSADLAGERRWVRGREVMDLDLDPGHWLAFNPLGHGGAAVLNEPAHRVLQCFSRPARPRDVPPAFPGRAGDVAAIITRLSQLEMIRPDGPEQPPRFQPSRLLTAWLHVTNDCNLRCPYCYVSKSAEGMTEETGRAAVAAVISAAVTHGFPAVKLKYAGGEASLNHRLVLALHARARKLAADAGLALHGTLLSNGVALRPGLIEALKAEDIRVMISLDGIGDQHDQQRPFASGRPSFRFVEKTIGQLLARDHPCHISITITGRNAGGVADVVRFALERDLTFTLNFFRDNDCAASFPDLRYEEQAMISGVLGAFGVIEEFVPRWSVLGSVLDRGQLLQPRQRSCGVGDDYVVIDQRGGVAKCHMEIERTLGDVFRDDPLRLVRQDSTAVLNLAVEEKAGCRDCTWRYWCTGGCTVATFRATGRYDVKSPNCNIYRAIYPAALRLEGLRLLKHAV